MENLLTAKDVTKLYKNQTKPGLDRVSLTVEKGEFLGIMGASGSGKTTLLNVLSTIDRPTSGDIRCRGISIPGLSPKKAADFRKKYLGFIFQEYFLLDSLTIEENIAVPLTLLHEPAGHIKAKVLHFAELFGIASQLSKYPGELSGGQRQRAAAARALVRRSPLIFADEPTGALDSASSTELLKALSSVRRSTGSTILMVTHDPYAASYTDRILYFKDGHITAQLQKEGDSRQAFYRRITKQAEKMDEGR